MPISQKPATLSHRYACFRLEYFRNKFSTQPILLAVANASEAKIYLKILRLRFWFFSAFASLRKTAI
nr:hypothetical protein [Campylobacter sp.]